VSKAARNTFLGPDNERYLSAASAWEISVNYSLGRVPLPGKPDAYVPQIREKSGIRGAGNR